MGLMEFKSRFTRSVASLCLAATAACGSGAASSNAQVENFLTQDFNIGGERISLLQGFGELRANKPAQGGGDRTGAYTWYGGYELGNSLATKKFADLKGKRVLDLGTGTGIVGISAVLSGAAEVGLTDGAEEIVKIASKNVESNLNVKLEDNTLGEGWAKVNGKKSHLGVGRLRWGNEEDMKKWLNWGSASPDGERYDVVVASEVAYEHKNIEMLLQTIKTMIKPADDGGLVILRLTPEITDDSQGLQNYLMPKMRDAGFKINKYPDLGDDVSQVVVMSCAK